jgi:cytochrome P450
VRNRFQSLPFKCNLQRYIEAHRKRDKARKDLAAIFDKVIQARRESGASEPDVVGLYTM